MMWRNAQGGGILSGALRDDDASYLRDTPRKHRARVSAVMAAAKAYETGLSPLWGPIGDPLRQIWVFALWPRFPDGAFVENANYCSLRAAQAPEWWVRCCGNNSSDHGGGGDNDTDDGDNASPISRDDTPLAHGLSQLARLMYACPRDGASESFVLGGSVSKSGSPPSSLGPSLSFNSREGGHEGMGNVQRGVEKRAPWLELKAAANKGAARFFRHLTRHATPNKKMSFRNAANGYNLAPTSTPSSPVTASAQLPVSVMPEYVDLCATLDTIFSQEMVGGEAGARWQQQQQQQRAEGEQEGPSGESMAGPRLVLSADFGSLTSLLSLRMCEYASDTGMAGVACLWASFVEEVAWHWENKLPLPRVGMRVTGTNLDSASSDKIAMWVQDGVGDDIDMHVLMATVNTLILQHRSVEVRREEEGEEGSNAAAFVSSPAPLSAASAAKVAFNLAGADKSWSRSPKEMRADLISVGVLPRKLSGLEKGELHSAWEDVFCDDGDGTIGRSSELGDGILSALRNMPMRRVLAELIGPALRAASSVLRYADSDAAAKIALDASAIPSLAAQMRDMDASVLAFHGACHGDTSRHNKTLEEALVSGAFGLLHDACGEIALTERMLSFATSLSRTLDNDATLVEALVHAEFPRDSQGNVDSRTTRADGSVLVIGEESRNAVRSALAMIRHGGAVVRLPGGERASGGSASDEEVEYPDEDEQGLPDPDIKEYVIRCVARFNGGEAAGRDRNSTAHRLYAMVERKAAHLRLACAVSQNEGVF